MTSITKRLNTLFETNDIIVWYDEEATLKETIEPELLNATLLEVANNEFGIKHQIFTASKGQKFLIYAPFARPSLEDNWLLDLELSGYLFSADRASMCMSDLGLDATLKPFVQKHIKFFDAKARTEPLQKLLESAETQASLAMKMMAVLSRAEPKLPHILITLLVHPKYYDELCKYGLDEYLWGRIKEYFDYNSSEPTLKDFGFKLLQTHFYSFIDAAKCVLNKEAVLFVKHWMDSSTNQNAYRQYAHDVEKELNLQANIDALGIDALAGCDTYEYCEQKIISHCIQTLIQADENFDTKSIKILFSKRAHGFWYGDYRHIYAAIEAATSFMEGLKEASFVFTDFDDGINAYISNLQSLDTLYRHYSVHADRSEHANTLKALTQSMEKHYLNGFLRPLNDHWQEHLGSYANTAYRMQRDFFTEYLEPLLEKEQRVFVIISDALRFECGMELKTRIEGLNRYQASISPLIGVLPSYTQLGIAALLPHGKLSFGADDDTVYSDGKSTQGTKNRQKLLESCPYEATYIDDEQFLALDRNGGREFSKAHQLIYIYHNQIDATGDKAASEHRVFDAVEKSFETIERIIKQIINLNGINIFITADHGFLYHTTETLESELCKVEKQVGEKRRNRRFIIAKDIEPHTCLDTFTASSFGIDGDEKIALAKSINKIRISGGGHRFVHGGATLQELIVPCLHVRKHRQDDVRSVEVSCLPVSQITTNSVMLSFYQEEPINDKIKPLSLKAGFYAQDGTLLSNIVRYTFESDDGFDRNREMKLRFDFKSEANNYSGQSINLVLMRMIEGSDETPEYKTYSVKLQLTFVGDFDDF